MADDLRRAYKRSVHGLHSLEYGAFICIAHRISGFEKPRSSPLYMG